MPLPKTILLQNTQLMDLLSYNKQIITTHLHMDAGHIHKFIQKFHITVQKLMWNSYVKQVLISDSLAEKMRYIYLLQKGNKVSVLSFWVTDTNRKCKSMTFNLTSVSKLHYAKVKIWPLKVRWPFWTKWSWKDTNYTASVKVGFCDLKCFKVIYRSKWAVSSTNMIE